MADSEEAAAPTVEKEEVSGLALSAPFLLQTGDLGKTSKEDSPGAKRKDKIYT